MDRLGYRERTWDEFLSYDARLECQGTSFAGGACAGHPWLAGNFRYAQAGSDGVVLVVCPRHWQLAQAQHRTRTLRGWWDGTAWRMLASGEEPPIEAWVEPSRSVPRTIATLGCWVAAAVVLAAATLWVVNAPRHHFNDRFCAEGIEAVYTIWSKAYLSAPHDERCDVVVGPRTVAAGMAAGGVVAMAVLGIPLLLTRRRPVA